MNLLVSLRKEDLSFKELQDMVGREIASKTSWLLWDQLAQFPSERELFRQNKAAVVLLQIEGKNRNPVGHFILLLDKGNHLEHFDSYGLTMEEELSITHEQHLSRIFKEYRKPIVNNTKKLQTLKEDVNTCGRWVVARLMLQQLSLEEFLSFIKTNFHIHTDDLVVAMTMLLQIKH